MATSDSKTLLQLVSSNSFSQAEAIANLPRPPCPHLLRSNTLPTESEISLLRDVITIAEEEESRLKEMVSSHTGSDRLSLETVRNLTHKLGRTRQFIIENNAILSSIRRIPPEILQNVFIHTLPTAATPGTKVLRSSQLPWALSQVCQLWRTIMLSFPDMWTDLPIVDLEEAHTTEKPFLDLLTELLKRSQNMPIRLTVVNGSDQDIGHPAIDMLVFHSDRWQEIKIHRSSLGLLSAFKSIKGRLSALQSLYLGFEDNPAPVESTIHDLFLIAPQLRHVDYNGSDSEQLLFPTHQLVHYSQTGEHLEQVTQAMLSSPSLRNLRFDVHSEITANTLPTVALRLPNLTVLNARFHTFPIIDGPFSTTYEPFFNNITTPALEELILKNGTQKTIPSIQSMILRSGCLLNVLRLEVGFAPGELQSLFSLTPLVTKLSIAIPSTQDISVLMFDGKTPPLLPLLEECEFLKPHDNYQFDLSMEAIPALKLLASSRCELPDNTTSKETLLSGEFHPLRTLRISLGMWSIQYQQYFEGWASSDGWAGNDRWAGSDMASELFQLHVRLYNILVDHLWEDDPPFPNFSNLEWRTKVDGLLSQLETLKIEKASDICISGIQYVLYTISEWLVCLPCSSIAKRILEKWEPVLRDDMPSIRWHTTVYYMQYLSTTQNHALCTSPDAMKFFYYGLDSNDISAERYVSLYATVTHCMGLDLE